MNSRQTFRRKQAGLSMPEIMLGLALIAIVTAGGLVAYNEVAPRARVNTLMAGMNPALVDITQFVQFRFQHGQAAVTSGPSGAGVWGIGLQPDGRFTICPTITAMAQCTTPCTWGGTPAMCGGGGLAGNINYVQFGDMPTFRLDDGAYDADADIEWYIPIGANDAIEVGFAVAPASNAAPFGAGNGDFSRCGAANIHAAYLVLAVESEAVCENLWTQIQNAEVISQAWCESDYAGFGANTDGEAAVLACVPAL